MSGAILIVDDEETDVFFLRKGMGKAGIENPVQIVSDGRQAVAYLQGTGKFEDRVAFPFPCLILLDLKLPQLMGLEVLRWIRQKARLNVVVVVLTSSNCDTDVEEAYNLGANAYMVKPSDMRRLEDMAQAVKHFWLTHNQYPPPARRQPESQFQLLQTH